MIVAQAELKKFSDVGSWGTSCLSPPLSCKANILETIQAGSVMLAFSAKRTQPVQKVQNSYLVPIASGIAFAVAVAVLLYLERSYLASWKLVADQGRIWEIILKAVAGFLAISGAIIAVLRYLDDKVHSTEIARREARKDFSVKQQEVYFKLIDATSTIANETKGTADRSAAEDRFWRLYWGEIVMVEDDAVAAEVDSFSDALWDEPDNSVRMLNGSMNLARACRESLGETWKVVQATIPGISEDRSRRDTSR